MVERIVVGNGFLLGFCPNGYGILLATSRTAAAGASTSASAGTSAGSAATASPITNMGS